MSLGTYAITLFALSIDISAASQAGQNANTSELEPLSRELPECAWNCFVPLVPGSACGLKNSTCLCEDQDFYNALKACVRSTCSAQDDLTATRIYALECGFPVRDRSEVILVTGWTLFSFAAIAVTLRLIARLPSLGGKGYGRDDWTILACLALLLPLNILLNLMVNLGLVYMYRANVEWSKGKDIWMLRPQQITAVLFWFWVEEYVYCAVVLLTKISILLLYVRLFPETERWFRFSCLGLIGASAVTAIPVYLTVLLQCTPISYTWHKWDAQQSGSCINTVAQVSTLAAVNMILDLVIMWLPVPLLLKLNIAAGKKIGVIAVFTVGLFVTATSAVRLQYVVHWGISENPTWHYSPLALWSAIETNITVVCACMPPLAGPIKRLYKGTIVNRLHSSEAIPPFRRGVGLSSTFLGEVRSYFENGPGSMSKLPTFVTARPRSGSNDEIELVGRSTTLQRTCLEEP